MPIPTPAVSVVVPVRNRRRLLEELLDALAVQTYEDFEVIVVDDGSEDGAGEMAAGRHIAGRPVRVVPGHGAGAVAARGVGVAASSGAVLAFTDSDCRPHPTWLEVGMACIADGADVVNGQTRPTRPLGPLERSIWSGDEGLYPTCNMFYRRTTFDDLGGFDGAAGTRWGFRVEERARGLGFGEDTLLGWRAHRSGAQVRYVPEARVDHHVFPPDMVESMSRSWMMAAFPALVREVPELRPTLVHRGVLWGPRSPRPRLRDRGVAVVAKAVGHRHGGGVVGRRTPAGVAPAARLVAATAAGPPRGNGARHHHRLRAPGRQCARRHPLALKPATGEDGRGAPGGRSLPPRYRWPQSDRGG